MSDTAPARGGSPFVLSLFTFTGRIGPARYWAAIACAFGVIVVAFAFAASAMDPRGGSAGVLLAIPFFLCAVWMLQCAMLQRLRDAGKPMWFAFPILVALLLCLFASVELIEAAPWAGALGLGAILIVVGHVDAIFGPRRKANGP